MQLLDFELEQIECTTRLPFRFGRTTMTAAPMLVARVTLRSSGGEVVHGHSADLLVPKWFDKSSTTTDAEDRAALVASARRAANLWRGAQRGAPLFAQWLAVYQSHVESVPLDAPDRLVRCFGVALVERALMDATCRAAGQSFFEAWRTDLFGVEAGAALTALRDFDPACSFDRAPPCAVRVRHTVGMADEAASEVPLALRGNDGHPCSLEEDIAAYGLNAFKVKVGGDETADLARLDAIGRVLAERAPGALVTLDGNEQYSDPGRLADVLHRLGDLPGGAAILDNLAHIEQPVPRALTLGDVERPPVVPGILPVEGLARLARFGPVIIDEADLGLEAFPRAFALGYRGVSVKNCKGVFRAVLNYGLCSVLGDDAFLAGEDLTNLPLLALQQDLATSALLRLPHVERNGHHFFRGLGHLSRATTAEALVKHPDMYRETSAGPALHIDRGCIRIDSLNAPGYANSVASVWPG